MISVKPAPGSMLTLYHVSPASRDSIVRYGLLPERSRGKLKAVWLVDRHMLTWAIAHTAFRHDVTIDSLFIYICHISERVVRSTRWPGIYYTTAVVAVQDQFPAAEVLYPPEADAVKGIALR